MRLLKRLYLKLRILYRKQYYKSNKDFLNGLNRTPLFICIKLLKINDTTLLIAPVSGDKYIYNERLGMLISLFGSSGTIVDRTYSYDIQMSQRDWDTIERVFSQEMEKRTKKVEEEITRNVKHSLTTVYSKLNKELKQVNLD
ncbi:hypothetical protein EBU94_03100 [bacterium]|nr:hypothetical protein [bacterium]